MMAETASGLMGEAMPAAPGGDGFTLTPGYPVTSACARVAAGLAGFDRDNMIAERRQGRKSMERVKGIEPSS
ncbi:hypothetical protein M9979_02685 [Sphingomonas sp. RP10(2022)]|uniref:Uncharacterized protein n=1 Tax=Sphingomonas liriopis TaxID=2949094 RepID=A0A9X2HP54_9SPHN|nr:hypothetical protein [Sphingomonas liriopis]MCP3733787.1 hypothetical protein [Sphingomonas liriopis]